MRTQIVSLALSLCAAGSVSGCGGGGKTSTGYALEGAPFKVVAGDTLLLNPIETFSDGTVGALAAGNTIAWSGVPTITALAPDSTAKSPIPDAGATPVAFFLSNPSRTDHAQDLVNRLVIRNAGTTAGATITLTGTISGPTPGTVSATIPVGAALTGDATNGGTLFSSNCAVCHGTTGDGSGAANSDGSFTIDNMSFTFPAPPLNHTTGAPGEDPAWNAGVFAVAARVNMTAGGVSLRQPMPDWLTSPESGSANTLTTQDFADIYAFMVSQTM